MSDDPGRQRRQSIRCFRTGVRNPLPLASGDPCQKSRMVPGCNAEWLSRLMRLHPRVGGRRGKGIVP